MSRIGKKPLSIPDKVKIIIDNNVAVVEGPKGKLTFSISEGIKVEIKDKELIVTRKNDTGKYRSLHGLTRSILENYIIGVTEGIEKKLKIVGVGYRALLKGKDLHLQIGFSHPVVIKPVDGIEFAVEGTDTIIVKGIDKQLVGEEAAKIRRLRPPEPYKGKGIRYFDEQIIKKAGKTGA